MVKLNRVTRFAVKHQPLNIGRGYTLIEILVSLTILSIIFGFGYVSFRDFSRRQAVAGVAKSINGDLRLTQEMALSGKKPDDAKCAAPNTLRGYFFRVDSAQSYSIGADCTGGSVLTKSVDLPSDISISTPSPNPILFKVLGQGTNLTSSKTMLTLTQMGTANSTTITISKEGEIK